TQLASTIDIYKSEENIIAGNTIDKNELKDRIEQEYWDRGDSAYTETDAIDEIKQEMIAEDLENFRMILNNLKREDEPLYYVTDGEHVFTNTEQTKREQFENYPVHYISEGYDWKIYPSELEQNHHLYGSLYRSSNPENTKIFVGYTENYVDTFSS